MSVSAIASLRPLRGQCLRQANVGLLFLSVRSRCTAFNIRAIVALQPRGHRHQSTIRDLRDNEPPKKDETHKPTSPNHDAKDGQEKNTEQPKLTFRQFWGRALTVSLRNLAFAMSPSGVRQAYRDSPISTSVILLLLAVTFSFGGYQLYLFKQTFYDSKWSRFPEPIATTLRRAIYYTTISPEPENALKYYKKAMAETKQMGLDPFSDEVLGIRIMVAFWLEKIENFPQSAQVLESILKDCTEWVTNMEQQVKDGKVDENGHLKDAPQLSQVPTAKEGESQIDQVAEPETLWRRRERLLSKAVSISVKLGELYADEHVLDPDNSHRHLVWSVETTLKEFRRRKAQGLKPGEESWLTPKEVGASMESLGRNYEGKSQFHLAIPLFFQALRNCESPCHRAVIMNNLSACFAQHPIYSPTSGGSPETESLKDLFASSMPNTRKDCLEAAANWAQNAYTHAKDVSGDARTSECDEACAVALCNWGDVAAMQGKKDLARRKYEACIEMSNKLEFPAGVKQAREGLKKLVTK